jgi:hypothetical protein
MSRPYAVSYMHWRQAEEALARMAANDPLMSGLVDKTCVGDARRNPLGKIAGDAASDRT